MTMTKTMNPIESSKNKIDSEEDLTDLQSVKSLVENEIIQKNELVRKEMSSYNKEHNELLTFLDFLESSKNYNRLAKLAKVVDDERFKSDMYGWKFIKLVISIVIVQRQKKGFVYIQSDENVKSENKYSVVFVFRLPNCELRTALHTTYNNVLLLNDIMEEFNLILPHLFERCDKCYRRASSKEYYIPFERFKVAFLKNINSFVDEKSFNYPFINGASTFQSMLLIQNKKYFFKIMSLKERRIIYSINLDS